MANRHRARPMVPQFHSSPDPTMPAPEKTKSLEPWIWYAACSIRGAKDAPKYKDYILPLVPNDPSNRSGRSFANSPRTVARAPANSSLHPSPA